MERPLSLMYQENPPWTLNEIDHVARYGIMAPEFADIVSGDNDVLHVIRQEIHPMGEGRKAPQQLLVIGSKHRTDYNHWYYEHYAALMGRWNTDTRDLGNRVIIREGDPAFWSGLESTAEAIDPKVNVSEASDGGLASAFSRKYGIPIIGGDFPYYGDIVAQYELYPDRIEEIITYYAMREIPIYARMQEPAISLETFLEQRLKILQRNMGKLAITMNVPGALDFSYDNVVHLHKKFFDDQEPSLKLTDTYLRYTSAHIEDKEFRERQVARIAIDRMRLSDAHFLLTIQHQLRLQKDVMVILGNHHTLALSNALAASPPYKPLPFPPNHLYYHVDRIDRPGPEGRIKPFKGGILVYPPANASRSNKGRWLHKFKIHNYPEESQLGDYDHVWPHFGVQHVAMEHKDINCMRALALLEVANRFKSNDYVGRLCQVPIAWEGDLLDIFHLLEHEGESVHEDLDLIGQRPIVISSGENYTMQLTPSLKAVLINAKQRLQHACGVDGNATDEISEWFSVLCRAIQAKCPGHFPEAHIVDKVNMASKQVAGLCRLFRTNKDFLSAGLSPAEQCSYALSFLHFATRKDFWVLRRLDQIVDLPYDVLAAYNERNDGRFSISPTTFYF